MLTNNRVSVTGVISIPSRRPGAKTGKWNISCGYNCFFHVQSLAIPCTYSSRRIIGCPLSWSCKKKRKNSWTGIKETNYHPFCFSCNLSLFLLSFFFFSLTWNLYVDQSIVFLSEVCAVENTAFKNFILSVPCVIFMKLFVNDQKTS